MKEQLINLFKTKWMKLTLAIGLPVVLLAAVCAVFLLNRDASAELPASAGFSSISVTAEKAVKRGISADSSFIISGDNTLTRETVERLVSFTPNTEFKTSKLSGGKYRLTPTNVFDANTLVSVTLSDNEGVPVKKWAFQTESTFEILSVLPGNEATGVPTDTGIEIRFSQKDIDVESFKKSFEITPAVNGSFFKYEDTMVFAPEKLKLATVYKVTIKNTVQNSGGDTLKEEKQFSFLTQGIQGETILTNYNEICETFLPEDRPLFELWVDSAYKEEKIKATVYKFNSADDYLAELQAYTKLKWFETYKPNLSSANAVMGFDAEQFRPSGNDWGSSYIILPQPLEKGWYAIEAKLSDKLGNAYTAVKLIQVSDLSVYSMVTAADGLFWLNSTASGHPVEGAKIAVMHKEGTDTGTTKQDGTALVKWASPDEKSYGSDILRIQKDGETFVDLLHIDNYKNENNYFTYLYTDREMYLPTDTVNVWGVLRPRKSGTKPPEDLKLVLTSGGSSSLYEESLVLESSGTYQGKLSFTDLMSSNYSWYELQVKSGDTVIASKSIRVYDYVKPIYVVTATTDKDLYINADETPVTVEVSCQFFEGTPAANMEMSLSGGSSYNGVSYPNSITLDIDGKGSYQITHNPEETGWEPSYVSHSASTESIDNTSTSDGGGFTSVVRDIMLHAKGTLTNNKPVVEVQTNHINLTGITTRDQLYAKNFPDNIKGTPADVAVEAVAIRHYYIKEDQGQYYDFINKKTVNRYYYQPQTEEVGTYNFKTNGGAYTLIDIPPLKGEDEYYEIKLRYADSKGRKVLETITFGNWTYYEYRYNDGIRRFSFASAVENGERVNTSYSDSFTNSYEYYDDYEGYEYYYYGNSSFTFGEDKNLSLAVNEGMTRLKPEPLSRFLTALVQENTFDVSVDSSMEHSVNYDEKLIPNANLVGAYFDGKHIFVVNTAYLSYDPSARELTVQIKPDKTKYRPSETVSLDILIQDKNKKPVSNADVCISVVDEAQFAIAPQSTNLLRALYRSAYSPSIRTRTSYVQHNLSGNGAESGGEGDSAGTRTKFVDTAAFLTAKTDRSGKAKLSFQLSDNLTQWRITALATNAKLYAGNSKLSITTSLPMFLSPVVADTFITGDTINFSTRTYGTAVPPNDNITYTALVEGGSIEPIELTSSAAAGENSVFRFGSLPEGDYTITLSGKYGKYADSLQLPFRVIGSNLEARISKDVTFEKVKNIKALRYPVTLSFYDNNYAFFNQTLSHLCGAYSLRMDARVSSMLARSMMYAFSESKYEYAPPQGLIDELKYNSSFKLLPYSEPDVLLTAKIAAAAPSYVSKAAVSSYLSGFLQRYSKATGEQVSAAYMGLAALGSPILIDLRETLKNTEGFSEIDKLRLISALALAGDYDGAMEYYKNDIQPKIKNWKGNKGQTGLFYDLPQKGADEVLVTAAASVTASLLQTPEAEGLQRYLTENQSSYDLTALEQMIYVQNFRPVSSETASFEYTSDKGRQTVTLKKRGGEYLTFSKEQLEMAEFKKISGNIKAYTHYIGSAEELMDNENKTIQVTKTIYPQISSMGYNATVTITIDAPASGYFYVEDTIPSGMRYAGFTGGMDTHLCNQEKQRVNCYIDTTRGYNTITYTVKAITPGSYVCEAPVVTMINGYIWGMGERQTVTIE